MVQNVEVVPLTLQMGEVRHQNVQQVQMVQTALDHLVKHAPPEALNLQLKLTTMSKAHLLLS